MTIPLETELLVKGEDEGIVLQHLDCILSIDPDIAPDIAGKAMGIYNASYTG